MPTCARNKCEQDFLGRGNGATAKKYCSKYCYRKASRDKPENLAYQRAYQSAYGEAYRAAHAYDRMLYDMRRIAAARIQLREELYAAQDRHSDG